jgi:hypothetical protein
VKGNFNGLNAEAAEEEIFIFTTEDTSEHRGESRIELEPSAAKAGLRKPEFNGAAEQGC